MEKAHNKKDPKIGVGGKSPQQKDSLKIGVGGKSQEKKIPKNRCRWKEPTTNKYPKVDVGGKSPQPKNKNRCRWKEPTTKNEDSDSCHRGRLGSISGLEVILDCSRLQEVGTCM